MRPRTRRDAQRKAPPYEVMKEDYCSGLTYAQMAEKYGCSQATGVYRTLKRRAEKRGEWPLRRRPPEHVPVATVPEGIVYVLMRSAATFAPTTSIRYRERAGVLRISLGHTNFPAFDPPRFHTADCGYLLRHDGELFAIAAEEAMDWGYQHCRGCLEADSLTPKSKTRRARTRTRPIPYQHRRSDQGVDPTPAARQAHQLPPVALSA